MRYFATPTTLTAGLHFSVAVSPSLEDVAVKLVGAAGGAVFGNRILTFRARCPAASVTKPAVVIAIPDSGSFRVRPTASGASTKLLVLGVVSTRNDCLRSSSSATSRMLAPLATAEVDANPSNRTSGWRNSISNQCRSAIEPARSIRSAFGELVEKAVAPTVYRPDTVTSRRSAGSIQPIWSRCQAMLWGYLAIGFQAPISVCGSPY